MTYGVQLEDNVIVDKLSKLFGADYLIPFVTEYKPHVITQGFRLASFFPVARSVRKAPQIATGDEVTELALTGAGSWAETDLKELENGKAEFNEKADPIGPLPLAVAVRREGSKSRLAVFGDSDFVSNGYLNLSGNKDLAFNTVAWLAADELAISIRPRARKTTPLYLKEMDQEFLLLVPVLGLPMSFFLGGTCVFFWRRRYH